MPRLKRTEKPYASSDLHRTRSGIILSITSLGCTSIRRKMSTAKSPREYLTALRLTLLVALGFGVGMGAVLAFGGILWI